jgi:hypothetical protein
MTGRLIVCLGVFLFCRAGLAAAPPSIAGTLEISGKPITVTHAYAHLHDNAEKLLSRPRELRLLFVDREVPPAMLEGIAFLPVDDLAIRGLVRGVLLKLDPRNPNDIVATLLEKPAESGQSLATLSLSVSGKQMLRDWKLTGDRVSGSFERQDERSEELPDLPWLASSVRFDLPIRREPPVTSDLKGAATRKSLQAQLLAASARALSRGDFAAAKALGTARANRRADMLLTQFPTEARVMARQAGAEMTKLLPTISRIVVRGDRAVAIFAGGKQWSTFAREGGKWKIDD